MYGWRARIGILIPADNTVIEPEIAPRLPRGVHSFSFRMPTIDHRELVTCALEVGPKALNMIGLNLLAYCCAASSFFQGVEGERDLTERLSEKYGVPSVTAAGAMVSSLRKRGARRIALLSPYHKAQTALLVKFLEEAGIEVAESYALELSALDSNLQYPENVYRKLKEINTSNSDALLITSTSFRTFEILEMAEDDLKIPVVSSNLALLEGILALSGFGNGSFQPRGGGDA